jgi:hypothetical protein
LAAGLAYARRVDALTSIADIVRTLIAKISTLFDVIDLSFFVSGGTCMLAFVYMRYVYVGALPEISGGLTFAIAILGSYVMGLLCFAMGRWFRRKAIGRPWAVGVSEHTAASLDAHGISGDKLMSGYLAQTARARKDALYPRLWTELRQDTSLKPSFELIASYWVRAAVYDGLIAALFVWGLAVWRTLSAARGFGTQPEIGYGALAFLGIGILACAREAGRSERFQVDEITATMAYLSDKRERDREEAAQKAARDEAARKSPALPAAAPAAPALGQGQEATTLAPGVKFTKVTEEAPETKGEQPQDGDRRV